MLHSCPLHPNSALLPSTLAHFLDLALCLVSSLYTASPNPASHWLLCPPSIPHLLLGRDGHPCGAGCWQNAGMFPLFPTGILRPRPLPLTPSLPLPPPFRPSLCPPLSSLLPPSPSLPLLPLPPSLSSLSHPVPLSSSHQIASESASLRPFRV